MTAPTRDNGEDALEGLPRPSPRKFSTTRWSLVLAAGHGTSSEAHEALSTLCKLYWYPLYAFTRRQGRGPEDARDSVQGFFTRLLEKNDLADVDRQRGRFRSWLLASLKHYLANEWDRERAQKRGGGLTGLSIDAETAEGLYQHEPSHDLTPEKLYQRRWTLTLLERVLSTLEQECARLGKQRLFEKLRGNLTGDVEKIPHAQVAGTLGMSEDAVKIAAHRLRGRYRELLREEIAQTVERPEDIEDEIRLLLVSLE
ncbi:MAG TPA: sigma-70 family RNA polymerase sigma factor [Archangium sp.]|uniref:RNA polymerase sigma factor n=1 Tax=Archangium sp. TaxID=1872627 RepID=UPI002E2F0B3E|nr:sigma-70 family RNA polymerase sigma factor [Archangium sp.]HEX5745721.1 sigma-70 family RNA polymerase sigma factor [Archangium sp.]